MRGLLWALSVTDTSFNAEVFPDLCLARSANVVSVEIMILSWFGVYGCDFGVEERLFRCSYRRHGL